jgi:hypothetical protein
MGLGPFYFESRHVYFSFVLFCLYSRSRWHACAIRTWRIYPMDPPLRRIQGHGSLLWRFNIFARFISKTTKMHFQTWWINLVFWSKTRHMHFFFLDKYLLYSTEAYLRQIMDPHRMVGENLWRLRWKIVHYYRVCTFEKKEDVGILRAVIDALKSAYPLTYGTGTLFIFKSRHVYFSFVLFCLYSRSRWHACAIRTCINKPYVCGSE